METVCASLNRPVGTKMASQPSRRLYGRYGPTAYNKLLFVLTVRAVSHFCSTRSPEASAHRLVSQEGLTVMAGRTFFLFAHIASQKSSVPSTVTAGNARPTCPGTKPSDALYIDQLLQALFRSYTYLRQARSSTLFLCGIITSTCFGGCTLAVPPLRNPDPNLQPALLKCWQRRWMSGGTPVVPLLPPSFLVLYKRASRVFLTLFRTLTLFGLGL